MSQLKEIELTDLEKLKFLKAFLPEEHLNAYKKDFGLNKESSFYFHVFTPFCRAYARFLLNSGSLTYYGSFLESFNDLIKRDRTYMDYKNSQNSLTNAHGGLAFLSFNYENAFIKDKRYKISNKEFRYESDLEYLISSELKEFFGDEIDVKNQRHHGYGVSDITINNCITLELKKGKAKRKDVYQAFEYSFDSRIKEVSLIASGFDKDTLEIANKLNVNCFVYCFIYEDYDAEDQYPVGFILEKVNKTETEVFEKIISEMDAFWISFYKPSFNFRETFEKEYQVNISIHDRTKKILNYYKRQILTDLENQGYDTTSQDLEKIIKQVIEQEVV